MSDATDLEPIRRAIGAARDATGDLLDCLHAVFPDFGSRTAEDVPVEPADPTPGSSGVFSMVSRNSAAVWADCALFAMRSKLPATMAIDHGAPVAMTRVANSDAWFHLARLPTGRTHNYTFFADGRPVGANSVAMFNPLSYRQPEAPAGRFLGTASVTSAIFPGAISRLWVYAPAAASPGKPLPLMLWLDGEGLLGATDALNLRAQVVIDNLTHLGRLPPMVHLFLSSPQGGDPPLLYPAQPVAAAMRSLQYDTVSDRFATHLDDEVLPLVRDMAELRNDGASRAVAGASSGGIAAFNAAWFRPQQWARVMSSIGSFTGLRWGDGTPGGHSLPTMVRRAPRKNLRV
jgi:enterochelin esterase family protein